MNALRLCLFIFSLLLITVAISSAPAESKTTTLAPKNDAPSSSTSSKTAPAKDIVNAKSIDGKEDETKNVKKGDLGKDAQAKADAKPKTNATAESPSEDAQEDLGVQENLGPTIPAYQIPEQPKDVKKKRWVGEPNIDFAIDNALGALFGRPQPPPHPPTVIEEVTYVDKYPDDRVVYKRSKSLPTTDSGKSDDKSVPSKEMDEAPMDKADTVSLKGEPIAVPKAEVELEGPFSAPKSKDDAPIEPPKAETEAPKVTLKAGFEVKGLPPRARVSANSEQKALPKMEVGDEVTILPAIEDEKDFGSSAENPEEMKYQRIAPEVAGLMKKSVPVSEKSDPEEDGGEEESNEKDKPSSENEEGEIQEKKMKEACDDEIEKKDENGQKEFVPVYPEEDKESVEAEKPQKDDPKAFEMVKDEESEAQKDKSEVENTDDGSSKEKSDDKIEEEKAVEKSEDEASQNSKASNEDKNAKAIPKEKQRHRESEELPINPKEGDEEEDESEVEASEVKPLKDHEPKKLPEEENTDEEESEGESEDNKEKNEDEDAPSDDKIEEDKAKIDAINPASSEISKVSESKEDGKKPSKNVEEDKLGPAAYPSEISDDDFSVDHKTGLMPAVSSHDAPDSDAPDSDIPLPADDEKSGDDFNVLQKLQDDVDAAAKKDQSPDYIVVEELKDPFQGHRKYTILKPTYREFHPTNNKLIEEVKATLDKSKVVKRSIKNNFEDSQSEESFVSSLSRDTVVGDDSTEEILKNVADAIERDGLRKPKKDQLPIFVPEEDPIPLKKIEKPSLNEILGIPKSAGPIMIEPEGGIPDGIKQLQSDRNEDSTEDYEAPSKVVIQSKQKITLVYDDDDSSEERTRDSSSSESSEEEEKDQKSQPWIPIMDISVPKDQTTKSKPIIPKIEESFPAPPSSLPMKNSIEENKESESKEEQLKKYSNILGNNLVITLSISPPILIIAGVICLVLLLFKIYWVLYSPPQTSIIPKHSAATIPNMDFRNPLSIVTVDSKKQPV